MSTLTTEQRAAIAALIGPMTLAVGKGSKESACSIAAINLALTGKLTDRIPDCMSEVIGSWIIRIQDRMPASIRNSAEWKRLLPLAAGTGRDKEQQRLALIMDWMWKALELVQPVADVKGFGAEWATMLREKTRDAAEAAGDATAAAYTAAAATAYAYAATVAAADNAATAAANAANAAAYAATTTAYTAATAAAYTAAAATAYAYAYAATWQAINPCGLLQELIAV
jgi:hypothetical protein